MSKYIWIDPEIFNEENMGYAKEIEEKYSIEFFLFKTIDEAIDFIKLIDFKETKIIISGKFYIEFIKVFKENITAICVAPKIIIFTSNEKKFLVYNKEYENINNNFYNIGGIATIIEEIEDFLFNKKTQNNESIFLTESLEQLPSKTQNANSKDTIEEKAINKSDEVELIFEYIDKKEKLILPLLFKTLIDNVSNDNIEKYTNFLYETYSEEYDEIKDLLEQIKPIKNIPIEILSKYYARLFTHY